MEKFVQEVRVSVNPVHDLDTVEEYQGVEGRKCVVVKVLGQDHIPEVGHAKVLMDTGAHAVISDGHHLQPELYGYGYGYGSSRE